MEEAPHYEQQEEADHGVSRGQLEGSGKQQQVWGPKEPAAIQLLGKGYEVKNPARVSLSGQKNSRNSLARLGNEPGVKSSRDGREQGVKGRSGTGLAGCGDRVTALGPSELQAGMKLSVLLGPTWSHAILSIFRISLLIFNGFAFLTLVGMSIQSFKMGTFIILVFKV